MTFRLSASLAITVALAVVAGHVTDATTGQPLPNVTIAIGSHRTTTDARGAYRLTGLTPGRYTLSAGSDDVPPQKRTVVIEQRSATTVDLVLCSTTLDYGCGQTGPG